MPALAQENNKPNRPVFCPSQYGMGEWEYSLKIIIRGG